MDTNITVNLKNEQKVQIHKCQGGICEEEIALYPPLFSLHTWTKTVPICVIHLLLTLQIKYNYHLIIY